MNVLATIYNTNIKQPLYMLVLGIMLFFACSSSPSVQSSLSKNIFRYAKNIYSAPGSNKVTVYFNWGTQCDSITYVLGDTVLSEVASHERVVLVPLKRVAALSTTHIAMLQEINEIESVVGVCDYYRMSNTRLWQKFFADSLADLGMSMHVNQESLVQIKADAIFKVAFSAHDFKNDDFLHSLNIPLIYTYSWH